MTKPRCLTRPVTDKRQTSAIFRALPNAVYIRVYDDGFVANRYKWPAPGKGRVFHRNGKVEEFTYDRKRAHGRGPDWSAMNADGNRVASY